MPPHCDTMDGPVVTAARKALENKNVNIILPWTPEMAEEETKRSFEKTLIVRELGKEAKDLADLWFFETVVRLHREGEGAPYTGLKPAGLNEGPVIPLVEKAIEEEEATDVIDFLAGEVNDQIEERLNNLISLKDYDQENVKDAREYIEAMLELTLYSHHLHQYIKSDIRHGNKTDKHGH